MPKGKLTSWSNLKLRAIEPALVEVNALSDYVVSVEPIKTGRRVTHVELRWWAKDASGTATAERELQFSKVGRKQRTQGDTVPARPGWLEARGQALRSETYETARLRHGGHGPRTAHRQQTLTRRFWRFSARLQSAIRFEGWVTRSGAG